MILPALDAEKLLENALTSIRLGVEDFQRCQPSEAGNRDPARALSAVRNLFAGVLLLFKYRIATSVDDPDDAASLLFNPPEVLPQANGERGVEWRPVGKFKRTTIDVATIKKRFEGFDIEVNWDSIDNLQDCRNHLEHLHLQNTLGEVADFVAQLFPVLRDFIQTQLHRQPAELLGSAWPIMLAHHQFTVDTVASCSASWEEAGVPEGMRTWMEKCRCEECGSSLLRANRDDVEDGVDVECGDDVFRYVCDNCSNTDLIGPLLIKILNDAHDYDPRDGGEPSIEECYVCQHDTFLIFEQRCLWCSAELDYRECDFCEEPLRQSDQDNGGLCDYHSHMMAKANRDD